jgi:prepilin-type N-terminal cleavage/methylation domain-containing protein/prepilin-type processing-associated H-X9-DG protein
VEGLTVNNIASSKRIAFTLIELLVVIAIIAILAAILFPVFAQARNQARKATCISNLKQLALGQTMYVQDYDEHFAFWDADGNNPNNSWNQPNGAGWWMNEIQPYIKNYGIYSCPNDTRSPDQRNGWGYAIQLPASNPVTYFLNSYGMNEWLTNLGVGHNALASINYPANNVMMADAEGPLINDWDDCSGAFPYGFTRVWYANYDAWGPWGNEQNYDKYKIYARHNEGSVIAYVDGHAGYLQDTRFRIEKDSNGVCPTDGKHETPLFAPGQIPY